MRKVFILLGAGSGRDIKAFGGMHQPVSEWDIFAFEANPKLIANLENVYTHATIMPYAAGTKDAMVELYFGKHQNNSSVMKEKVNVSETKSTLVPVMDFPKWVEEHFTEDDHIVLCVDIEGAEYDIIDAMIVNHTLDWVNELYIEFHGQKLTNFDMARETAMIDFLIKKFGDKV